MKGEEENLLKQHFGRNVLLVSDGEWEGMVDQHMDIPVNIRARTGMNGDEYAAFYVTEVGLKCDVLPKTGVWDVARDIQGQLKGAIERDEHLLFAKAKGEWENGGWFEP